MSSRLRICLITHTGKDWMGGVHYIRTLARGISMAAERDHCAVDVDIPVRTIDRKAFEIGKVLAVRLPFLPLRLCNLKGYDFAYPCIAGKRAPYGWGAWIPDFQELYLPQFFTPEVVQRRRDGYQRAADTAPVIVVSSEMARQDFIKLFPETESRCSVLHFSSYPGDDWTETDPKGVQDKYELPDRFFIVCNQFWMHKDHGTVFRALSILRERGVRPTVVCTGYTSDSRNLSYFQELTAMIERFQIQDQVRILGLIPRIDQVQLLRRSLAVIQPSLFEGWSTVVEDARTLGKPILLSDFPVHREQNPPGARYFARSNAEELAELMIQADSELSPGPDPTVEDAAIARARNQTMECGQTFLNIVRTALK